MQCVARSILAWLTIDHVCPDDDTVCDDDTVEIWTAAVIRGSMTMSLCAYHGVELLSLSLSPCLKKREVGGNKVL